jgi:hypothetical protein
MIIVRPMTKVSSAAEILGVTTAGTGGATSLAVTLPDIPLGETWVLMVGAGFNTMNTPSGWTLIYSHTSVTTRTYFFSRVRQSGDSTALTMTFGATIPVAVRAYGIGNCGLIRATGSASGSQVTTHPTPSIAATMAGSLTFRFAYNQSTSATRAYTWDSGATTVNPDFVVTGTGIMGSVEHVAQGAELYPVLNATHTTAISYSVGSISISPKLDQGIPSTQRGTLTANQTTTVGSYAELGPLTAGTNATVVGNALVLNGTGNATLTVSTSKQGGFGNLTIRAKVNGAIVAEGTASSSGVFSASVSSGFEAGSLLTIEAMATTATSNANILTTSTYIEIVPI